MAISSKINRNVNSHQDLTSTPTPTPTTQMIPLGATEWVADENLSILPSNTVCILNENALYCQYAKFVTIS